MAVKQDNWETTEAYNILTADAATYTEAKSEAGQSPARFEAWARYTLLCDSYWENDWFKDVDFARLREAIQTT